MSGQNRMVKLKNGGEAPDSAVKTTMMTLEVMITGGVPTLLAAYDLAEHCREGVEITGRSRILLEGYGLMQSDGRVHDVIRDVVLSAAEGEGMTFGLTSPYAED